MTSDFVTQLTALLGPENIRTDADARTRAASSWSPLTSKRKQAGRDEAASVVALPGTTEEVASLVRWANQTRTPVFTVGGNSNTSDSGARAGIALDLSRLDGADLDEQSLLVTVGAGRTLGSLEEDLNRHAYTLGSLPQSQGIATVGGSIASNMIGVASGKYGRMDDLTAALTAVLPSGEIITSNRGARAAFDLPGLLIGTEGQFGIVTEARLKMHPLPDVRAFAPFTFTRFEDAVDALRLVYRSDARPSVARIFDRAAAANLYNRANATSAPFLLLLAFEGDELTQTGQYQLAYAVCQKVGGTIQTATLGDFWWDTRTQNDAWAANARPGAVADVFAVSASWQTLAAVEKAMRNALAPRVIRLSVQIAHATPHGAALEWTWQAESGDPDPDAAASLYEQITDVAFRACLDAGGSLFPYYGIGRARRRWLEMERGPEVAVWRSLKAELDPHNVLNPNVLLQTG